MREPSRQLPQSGLTELDRDELRLVRPFYILLYVVVVGLYVTALYQNSQLREPITFVVFSLLMVIHGVLHWFMPRLLVKDSKWLWLYFIAQGFLVFALGYISQN